MPVEPLTRTRSPVLIRSVASDVPTTAGMPNSRDTTAGWAATPPASVTSPRDLREQHDPGRVRHPADEDLAVAHLVELVERRHEPGDPLDDARRRRQPVQLVRAVRAVAGGTSPGSPTACSRGTRAATAVAVPTQSGGRTANACLALVPAVGDERPRVEGLRARPSGGAARCSAGTSRPRGRRRAPSSTSRRPIATSTSRTRAFVPWSMKKWWSGVSGFMRSERSSAACSRSRPSPAGDAVHELVHGRLEVVLHRRRARPGSRSRSRGSRARPRRSAPGSPARSGRRTRATRSPCCRTPAGTGAGAPRRSAGRARMPSSARSTSPRRCRRLEGRAQLGVALDLLLHPPERLDRVPVAVVDRALEPAREARVDLALDLLDRRVQRHRGRELGEVQHPVDLPVAVVDVDRVLEQHGELDERRRRPCRSRRGTRSCARSPAAAGRATSRGSWRA